MFKNKFLTGLLSVVIACGLWLYVITVVSPGSEDTFDNIPVSLRNDSVLHDRGLMITSGSEYTVTLKLSGNRTDLAKLNKDNITLVADLATIYEPGTQSLSYTYSFPGDVADDAVSVLDRNPGRLTVTVEQMISKEVPLNVECTGTLPSDDYIVDKDNVVLTDQQGNTLMQHTVDITGPKSVIDQITQGVITVDLTDRNTAFSENCQYVLCDAAGKPVDAKYVTATYKEIGVRLEIQRVKEIALKFDIIPGGGATADMVSYEPKSIKISGSESILELMDEELVLGTLNLGEMKEDAELIFPIELPAGVTNRTGIEEIMVTVKFSGLMTKTFTVNNITATNVPEGHSVDIITRVLQITVRGPKAQVEKMTEKDLTVSVDCGNEQAGSFTASATITPGAGFEGVGAMGTYRISATMRKP